MTRGSGGRWRFRDREEVLRMWRREGWYVRGEGDRQGEKRYDKEVMGTSER